MSDDYLMGQTIFIEFTTKDANGAPVAPSSVLAPADFKIYKDHGTTEMSGTPGITVTTPFDSLTGVHVMEIDTSNNGDAGFHGPGHDYFALLDPRSATVDSQPVREVVGKWSIENRSNSVLFNVGHTMTGGSASSIKTNLTLTDDQLNGRRLIMLDGNLSGQHSSITDCSADGTLIVNSFTAAADVSSNFRIA